MKYNKQNQFAPFGSRTLVPRTLCFKRYSKIE